jgi:hypothetical protein
MQTYSHTYCSLPKQWVRGSKTATKGIDSLYPQLPQSVLGGKFESKNNVVLPSIVKLSKKKTSLKTHVFE